MMKIKSLGLTNIKKIFLFVVLAALFSLSAFAIEVTNPALGSSSANRGDTVSTTFTIKNTDPANNLTITQITSTADSKYNITFTTSTPITIQPNSSTTVTIQGDIPKDLDAVNSNYEEAAMNIGTLTVSGTLGGSSVSKTATITMQAENNLRIKKFRLRTETSSKSMDDGDTFKNVRPGDEFTYEAEIENRYSSSEDVEFDTVYISVESENSDVDVDEEDDEIDSLGADEEDTVSGSITVEEEADKDATITVTIHGTDENGALHGQKIEFRLDVNRLTHDLKIRKIAVSP
ncbi:hypothetical protein DRJ22_04485, partial [Candidatus Woesearchaeota archaeon]